MGYTLIEHVTPKARRPHPCTWCGEQILAGESYERQRYVFDGEPMTNKMHKECFAAASEFFLHEPEASFDAGSFKRGTLEER